MLKEVIEEPVFMEEIEELHRRFPRIYEIKDAIVWELARNPFYGQLLPGHPDIRVGSTQPVGSIPSFWVLYKVDDEANKVHLLSILPLLDNEDEEYKAIF